MINIQYTKKEISVIHKHVTFYISNNRLHSFLEKSLIERVMQYFNAITECFDDYYPCIKQKYSNNNRDLEHVYN
ncbi:MAG: hypothetical protein MRJ93_12210 [Nitrososphaeraceae archaeon]|nr:hypothetical protein [Nitrososphaeraceae archaeon]